jgi:adenylate cyclase
MSRQSPGLHPADLLRERQPWRLQDRSGRLSAILAADVVGYSRLVEHDEAGTLSALKVLRREVIDPLLAEHQGRIVKLMGDGALVAFGSVVDAVACAVGIQKGVAENQTDTPTERRIVFRIGVNLGDVIHEVDGEQHLELASGNQS